MHTLSGGTDPVLERVVEQASELLHAPKVGLAVIEPGGTGPFVLRFVATRGMSAEFSQRIRPTHWRDGTTAIAIHERRPVWSADLLDDPGIDLTDATRRAVQAEGYRAVLSVPLLAQDHVLGALVLYRDEPGPFSPEAQRQVVRIEASHGIDVEGVGAPDVGVELPSADTGIVGIVLRDRQPTYGRDIQSDPRRSPRLIQQVRSLHAFAALPLVAGDRAVGVLFLIFADVRDFDAEEQEIMRLLADQAAIAIRQAQLYRDADHRREEAEVMAELASNINATLELDDVLKRAAPTAGATWWSCPDAAPAAASSRWARRSAPRTTRTIRASRTTT